MGHTVDLDDLVDGADIAELIGVASANVVGIYRRRYADFPAPVWVSRGGRCQLWLQPEIERWARSTGRVS
jgi:hypothetical protein